MSKVSERYQFHPENFVDDLVEALSNAFSIGETRAREQHEVFLNNLFQDGYEIVPRSELIIEREKEIWFIRVFLEKDAKKNELQLFSRLKYYNFRTTSDIESFRVMLRGLEPSVVESTEARVQAFRMGSIDIKLSKIKL